MEAEQAGIHCFMLNFLLFKPGTAWNRYLLGLSSKKLHTILNAMIHKLEEIRTNEEMTGIMSI